MSNSKKIVLGILILIIIGAGIWYKVRPKTTPISTEQPAGSENQNPEPGLTTASSDISDIALDQDLQTIEQQLENINSDISAASQSISDQQSPTQ